MINEIFLPDTLQQQYQCANTSHILTGLNRVNIFVGPNNSGKSRLLRGLYNEPFKYHLSDQDFRKWRSLAEDAYEQVSKYLMEIRMDDVASRVNSGVKGKLRTITETLNQGGLPGELNALQQLESLIKEFQTFQCTGGSHLPGETGSQFDAEGISRRFQQLAANFANQIPASVTDFSLPNFQKTYVPILRGLRPVQINGGDGFQFTDHVDNYKNRTAEDYFIKSVKSREEKQKVADNLSIVTGLSLYEEVKRMMLGTIEQRDRLKDFETFLSQSFFDGQALNLIPQFGSDCLLVTLNKVDRPIYALGDGIQNLIILLYPTFFHADKSLLCFIEEPEISLHPGMQRLFIDTIMREEFTNVQFFLTTHSNHFLDMTLDHSRISIYNFQKQDFGSSSTYSVVNTDNEDIKLLDALGVRNSSLFISNCTIWVEGITDRLYLNKYMDLLQREEFGNDYETKRLKEDLHYSYIEYGGANLVHYAFDDKEQWEKIQALKICSKILLVMDEDSAYQDNTSFKYNRIQELKEELGDRLVVLPCREIENTLSAKVLKAVIRKMEGKAELDFSNFTEQDYKDVYLGDFIHENFTGIKRRYRNHKGSGTVRDKVGFCRKALDEVKSVDDLSGSASTVGLQILHFIRSQNH